jgi:hypothetical protein
MPAIRLVPFDEQHLPGLRLLVADPSVRRYTRVPEPVPHDFEQTWADRYQRGRAEHSAMNFAIEDAVDGAFLGLRSRRSWITTSGPRSSATSSALRHVVEAWPPRHCGS